MDVPMLSFFLVVLLVATTFEPISSLPSTIPAFLWSPGHRHGFSNNILQKYVDYQTISPQELATSVLYEGGWSNILVLVTFHILFWSSLSLVFYIFEKVSCFAFW